jgi:transcriptional regulator with XRE-family HTH domain
MAERHMAYLAQQIRERRERLGLYQHEVHDRGGPTVATVRQVEGCKKDRYSPDTYRRLDIALELRPGSALNTAMAGVPLRPAEEPEAVTYADPALQKIWELPLREDIRRALIALATGMRDNDRPQRKEA